VEDEWNSEAEVVWVAKVSELIGSSEVSFEDAARIVLRRANRNLRGITGIEVVSKRLKIEEGHIVEYRVRLRLSFNMVLEQQQHW
jgi:flavin-binding protein dodecin